MLKTKKDVNSWFEVIEIEVNSHCNRKCSYCPRDQIPLSSEPRLMTKEIFTKIIGELEKNYFSGRLSYHFYNEPLLRSDLEDLVSYVSKKIPNTFQLLFTNGDFLTEERYISLKRSGIKHFVVTRHDYQEISQRNDQTIIMPDNIVLTNRGGSLFCISEPLKTPCYAPSEMLVMTVTGDVLFCFEDAKRTIVMGNILTQNLEDIWFSEQFSHIRKLLREGKREYAFQICKDCNNSDFVEPKSSWFPKIKNR